MIGNKRLNFNHDSSNQAQEVLFSRKLLEVSHPKLSFSNSDIAQTNSQKHFGVVLDSKSMFHDLDIVFTKVRKAIGLLRKLNIILLRIAFVTIFKTFAQPHLDYSDVLYDQAFKSAFQNKLESIQ